MSRISGDIPPRSLDWRLRYRAASDDEGGIAGGAPRDDPAMLARLR